MIFHSHAQDILTVMRNIEDIPTRTELIQYERRFVELYEQVAMKLQETRKYYHTFNNLTDKKTHLAKEVSLLTNIDETFGQCMASKDGKEKFTSSMGNIITGVNTTVSKVCIVVVVRHCRTRQWRDS
eukprot:GFYU01005517.1.p1 GENE.GFYU01005517.1~~GFYU01005517.1.p1  ORF type:complete len:127 (+),score=26.13 GFYU01005517.1:237-617(+)